MQCESTCYWTFNNGREKFRNVRNGVNSAVENLEHAVNEFDAANLTLQETVNATTPDLFNRSVALLRSMLGRRVKLDKRLHATLESLNNAKQKTSQTIKVASNLMSPATETDNVVRFAAGEISKLPKSWTIVVVEHVVGVRKHRFSECKYNEVQRCRIFVSAKCRQGRKEHC
ncbi:hypothetical protein ERJ75_000414400 [Trypanosoma vivax]|nr:hypothetical protein ERJ75_000414400 [Trypanosoma vivax]